METTKETRYRLAGLKASNYKTLRAVDLTFDAKGGVVEVSGANRAGKSTLIDLLWDTLGGKPIGEPIRRGEDEASAEARLAVDGGSVLIARRRWWIDDEGNPKTALKVTREREDGGRGSTPTKPQSLLNALLDPIAANLDEWLALGLAGVPGKREQAQRLIDALKLEAPPELAELAEEAGLEEPLPSNPMRAIEIVSKALETSRRDVGRDLKEAEGKLAAYEGVEECEVVDASALKAELEEHEKGNRGREDVAREHERAKEGLIALDDRIAKLRSELAEAEEAREGACERVAQLKATKLAMGPPEPTEGILERLASAAERNAEAQRWQERLGLEDRVEALSCDRDRFEEALARVRGLGSMMLAGADLGVEGLAFGADGLTLNGLPFPESASSAEQVRVAVACIAACHPKLRVLRIKDGSRLDSEHKATVHKLAEERDLLVLMELVEDGSGLGLVIEDGSVVEDRRGQA